MDTGRKKYRETILKQMWQWVTLQAEGFFPLFVEDINIKYAKLIIFLSKFAVQDYNI